MATLQEIEAAINELQYGTPEYHEALAYYFLTLARAQWRMSDLAYAREKKHGRQKA